MKGRAPFVVVFDCDGTLTPKMRALCGVVDEYSLPQEARQEILAVRERYLGKALAGNLSLQDEVPWLRETLDLYVKYQLTLQQARESIAKIKPRAGVRECLLWLKKHNIPVAVISYSAAQFVQEMLVQNDLFDLVDQIYSAELATNRDGCVIGYNLESFVVPSNKGKCSRMFADRHGVSRKNILAVGDSPGDKKLGHLKRNRIAIAKDTEDALILTSFTSLVVITEDFDPITTWLRKKISLVR